MMQVFQLVELPRQLWQASDRGYRLSKAYFNVDKLSTEKNDAEDAVQEVYRYILQISAF